MALIDDSIIQKIDSLIKEGEGLKPPECERMIDGDIDEANFRSWLIKVLEFLEKEMKLPDTDRCFGELKRLESSSINKCIYKDREVKSALNMLENIKISTTENLIKMNSEETIMLRKQLDYLSKLNESFTRDKAIKIITEQKKEGNGIRNQSIDNADDVNTVKEKIILWNNKNVNLLKLIFDEKSVVEEYESIHQNPICCKNLEIDKKDLKENLDKRIDFLESVIEGLKIISETENESKHSIKSKIFVVHGRDHIKDQLEILLLRWGFDPIVLDDQPSKGRTIIEKFEDHSSEAQCAIILLTPDDEGRLKGTDELKPRARQNVILELGYFYGKLGRDRVICLYKSDVEIPSDISGIVYVPFKENLKREVDGDLRKELKAMGFEIND